tara:strand:- start:330 stop:578 length:249 start_codon:yes stop_codon:yes gene_type:complete
MFNTHDTLEVLSREEILEKNVKDLQEQLDNAYRRVHVLHDVINNMKVLAQSSADNSIKSIDISNGRWENEDGNRHYWNKEAS